MRELSVSVIIPSFNGEARLPVVIASLSSQDLQPQEIIVVIDGSTDHSVDVMINLVRQYPLLPLRFIYQRNLGRAGAKNKGLSECSSDVVVFMDDDMLASSPMWLSSHLNHHLSVSNSIATGILISKFDKPIREIEFFNNWRNQRWNIVDHKIGTHQIDFPYIQAGNFSVKRLLMNDLGGFDSSLTDLEDRVLAITALRKNIPLFIVPEAQLTSLDVANSSSFYFVCKRACRYEKARRALIKLKPDYASHPVFVTPTLPLWKKLFYDLFAHSFWLDLIEHNFFIVLPRPFRFKVYEVIIYACSKFKPIY